MLRPAATCPTAPHPPRASQIGFAIGIIVIIYKQLFPAAGFYEVCSDVTGACESVYWDGICL